MHYLKAKSCPQIRRVNRPLDVLQTGLGCVSLLRGDEKIDFEIGRVNRPIAKTNTTIRILTFYILTLRWVSKAGLYD
jgi:hypothetical protein